MKLANRALFLGCLLVGLIAGLPAFTIAKGQWCNDQVITHSAKLTVRSATVAGVAVTPPDRVYELISSRTDPRQALGYLFCPGCPGQVATRDGLERQP